MSGEMRTAACRAAGRGMLAALCVTLPGMTLIALAAAYALQEDGAVLALNQALKLASVFAGAYAAVGPGGTRGFALGAVVGLCYIALGYGVCALWGGLLVSGPMLAAEFFMGLMLGGLCGAFTANLPARSGARKRRAQARGRI